MSGALTGRPDILLVPFPVWHLLVEIGHYSLNIDGDKSVSHGTCSDDNSRNLPIRWHPFPESSSRKFGPRLRTCGPTITPVPSTGSLDTLTPDLHSSRPHPNHTQGRTAALFCLTARRQTRDYLLIALYRNLCYYKYLLDCNVSC